MKMMILVPSMGRAMRVADGVLRFSSPEMRKHLTYVVRPEEHDLYRESVERFWPDSGVTVVVCEERGIAHTRHWIGRTCAGAGVEKFLMLDDDVWFYTRTAHDRINLEYSAPHQVDEMLLAVERSLDEYAHVGISAREGNNRVGAGGPDLAAKNTRTLRALAYRTEEFLSVEHGRVDVMEDFDVNLQLLRRGHENLNLCYWAQGQRQTNEAGGCSAYRTHELHERSARRLAELHAPFVGLRDKKNKSGGEFGTRKEVTIQWKRAYRADV